MLCTLAMFSEGSPEIPSKFYVDVGCHHRIFKCSETIVESGFPLGGKERQRFALCFCTWEKEGEKQPALQKSTVFHWCGFLE